MDGNNNVYLYRVTDTETGQVWEGLTSKEVVRLVGKKIRCFDYNGRVVAGKLIEKTEWLSRAELGMRRQFGRAPEIVRPYLPLIGTNNKTLTYKNLLLWAEVQELFGKGKKRNE